ncbi:Oidioi.mRNA.OKI2018_I69.chr2.g4709.t1.cds [Oikopleura dioica]|uniref:Oidioi.mRNA.OKI2018_I69.chr2.g4709.t1.cds n=1 Tax=Oikopleura dioica TaxID=34765 RepID=A0ABN7SYA3_OIKDI|nr:Oidioi.mRNA.OKI2018_I69.chr2.g4709.t1.cds [Oikopleura dioica]
MSMKIFQYLLLQVFAHGNVFKLKSFSPDDAVAGAANYDKRGPFFKAAMKNMQKRGLAFDFDLSDYYRQPKTKRGLSLLSSDLADYFNSPFPTKRGLGYGAPIFDDFYDSDFTQKRGIEDLISGLAPANGGDNEDVKPKIRLYRRFQPDDPETLDALMKTYFQN